MLSPHKAEEYLAALEIIRFSGAETSDRTSDRFTALAKLFYHLVKAATNEEMLAFRNFYARFRYLLSTLKLSDETQNNFDAFRRLLKEGDEKKVTPQAIQQGIALLQQMIGLVSRTPVQGAELPSTAYFTKLFPTRNYAALRDLKILCSTWTELSGENENSYFILRGYDLLNLQSEVGIYIKRHAKYDLTAVRGLLTENTVLQLQNLRFQSGTDYPFSTTYDSLIILEPDFLMDATAIGECFSSSGSNSDQFFLSRLMDNLPGSAALKGSIIGYYLDEMMRGEVTDMEQIYLTAQRLYAMKAAQLGSAEMLTIRQSIYQEHLRNITALVRKEGNKKVWIEPTYFSKEYGLQGRLDLLCINQDLDSRDIIELKSGSPSNPNYSIAWSNHKMQVVCYDMLLESAYGPNRRGSNMVFYSRCTISPYRNLVSEVREKQDVVSRRNEIVANIYKLAAGDYTTLQRIHRDGIRGIPPFGMAALQAFQQFYDPKRIASQYYQELVAFTLRELINAKVGDLLREDDEEQQNGFAGLWLDSLSTKESDFRILYDLQVTGIDRQQGNIGLSLPEEKTHSFRKGDPVILYPQTEGGYNALSQYILKGSIKELHLDRLVVTLANKQTDYDYINEYQNWAIEPDLFERNYWSTISCLFNVLTCSDRKKRLLFGHEKPAFDEGGNYHYEELTDNQNKVLRQALNARDYYLLQGPPGTGKTSTFLVYYVQELLQRSSDKIIVLAFTNKAVEKICQSFREPRNGKAIKYLRFGSRHVADEALFLEQLEDENPDHWRAIIDQHQVFVSTVASFQNNLLLLKEFIPYKQVIIDEASQLTEAAIAGILVLFDKFVLIGDHKQLPAVITQDDKKCLTKNDYLNQLGITDFKISLFERLIRNAEGKALAMEDKTQARDWENVHGQLRDHYRMHQQIAARISRHYTDELIPGTPEQTDNAPAYELPKEHLLYGLTTSRIIFLDSPSEPGLKKNRKEAYLAATIVDRLIREGVVDPSQIGIITPFRAQIAEIKKFLPKELLQDERFVVDTVERYQGDEREIILFSTTISNPRQVGAIQSLTGDDAGGQTAHVDPTDRKLLVSLSRASKQFILLGNYRALSASEIYKDLIGQIQASGGFLNSDFAIRVSNSPL